MGEVIVRIKAGLGNQLFQYATARRLAINENREIYFDLSFYNDDKFNGIYRLDKYNIDYKIASSEIVAKLKNKQNTPLFYRLPNKINIANPYNKITHWKQKQLNQYLQGKLKVPKSIYLDDWFARPYNFGNIREVLLSEIVPNALSEASKNWQDEIENTNSVSIHIRRGDFVSNPHFHNLPVSHYINAINYIKARVHSPSFFVFTDDLEFVKNELSHLDNICFVDSNNQKQNSYSTYGDLEDLYLMSKCKHNIIANSTFSWWGAWLNNNPKKIVIAPKAWFNNKEAQVIYNKGNLVPAEWIKM
jgi:hypothetical protein